MLARWFATVAALLLACAQASAHVRSERAADFGTFAAGTEHALEIRRSAANASPGELAQKPKTAPPARASLENSASGENAPVTHCHAWENWSPLKKCASGVDKYLYGNGNPGSYIDPDGRVGFLTDLRDWFNETDRNLREYAENTPYVGGAIGLVRGATSLASAPVRAVNTASDAVAGALPFEVTSGVAEEGAIAFGESVDLGVYVANNKAAVAGAIKDNVIDTASRTFFDRDGAAASDFVSGFTQLAVPSPAIAGGVASTVGRLTPSVTRGLQSASRSLAAVRDRVVQAFRVAESPSGSPEMRFDIDAEAGSGFLEHEVLSASPAAAAFSDRTIIRVDSNGTATIHVGPHRLGPYSEVAGHHPHQQAARSNNPNYNPQSAITLADDGTFDHTAISRMQLKLNAEARRSGLEYTLAVEEAIQRQAMAAGKILDEDVLAILKLSRKGLQSQGALEPTRIPGARKGN